MVPLTRLTVVATGPYSRQIKIKTWFRDGTSLGVRPMSKQLHRSPRVQGATVSLVALVASALTSEAIASLPTAELRARETDLSARVMILREQIRSSAPTLVQGLSPEKKLVQWRNR